MLGTIRRREEDGESPMIVFQADMNKKPNSTPLNIWMLCLKENIPLVYRGVRREIYAELDDQSSQGAMHSRQGRV